MTTVDPNAQALFADPIVRAFGRANAALYAYRSVLLNKAATPEQVTLLTAAWNAAFAAFNAVLNDPATPEGPLGRATARRWLGR